MNSTTIVAELETYLGDPRLDAAAQFRLRAQAEATAALAIEYARYHRPGEDLDTLRQNAAALRRRVQATNERVVQRWRNQIQAGGHSRDALIRFCADIIGPSWRAGQLHTTATGLDDFVDGLLELPDQPTETRPREREMIQYEAAPAPVVLELAQRLTLAPDDVFYDLGSGLGSVVILSHLLTGAVCKGVEFEPAYCQAATAMAARLRLADVAFINADARDLAYDDGRIFFMFTPFKGQIMRDVLCALRERANHGLITVASFGYCTLDVAAVSWLRPRGAAPPHPFRLAVFDGV